MLCEFVCVVDLSVMRPLWLFVCLLLLFLGYITLFKVFLLITGACSNNVYCLEVVI